MPAVVDGLAACGVGSLLTRLSNQRAACIAAQPGAGARAGHCSLQNPCLEESLLGASSYCV